MKRARIIIFKDDKLLTIKRTKPDKTYWVIPGGGVEDGETCEQAAIREAKEELGLDVKVRELALKMDSTKPELIGQEEYFYICDITGGELGSGTGPEYNINTTYVGNYDIEWIEIKDIDNYNLLPIEIKDYIKKLN